MSQILVTLASPSLPFPSNKKALLPKQQSHNLQLSGHHNIVISGNNWRYLAFSSFQKTNDMPGSAIMHKADVRLITGFAND